jgi:hypothetical protein
MYLPYTTTMLDETVTVVREGVGVIGMSVVKLE